MTTLLEVVDTAPTSYLLALAWLMFRLGDSIRRRFIESHPFQEAAGAFAFVYLVLRRLFIETPEHVFPVIHELMRCAAFGTIAFGIAGTLCIAWHATKQWLETVRFKIYLLYFYVSRWWTAYKQRVAANKPVDPWEQQRVRIAQTKYQTELHEREKLRRQRDDLKLQAELDIEFAADAKRSQKIKDFIKQYANESLPLEVYEKRLDLIRNTVLRQSPSKPKHYTSVQEIIDDFQRQVDDIENSNQPEAEKRSLISVVRLERQNMLQRYFQS